MSLKEMPAPQASRTAPGHLHEILPRLAFEITRLDPGSAAALRRGPLGGAGAAAFWKLMAEYVPDVTDTQETGWATMVQCIALLTPKGREPSKKPAHDHSVPMGQALQKAGLSEVRLARLLAAPHDMRRTLSIRLCRWLATGDQNRFNLVTLGHFILFDNDPTDRRIAREYYRADATARRREAQDKETTTDA